MCAHACTPDCRKMKKKKQKKGREKRVKKVFGMNAHRSCESYPRLKITYIYLLLHCKTPSCPFCLF